MVRAPRWCSVVRAAAERRVAEKDGCSARGRGNVTASYYEFFAGGGMARAGLGEGWTCLFANDIDAKKGASYAANWGVEGLRIDDVGNSSRVVATHFGGHDVNRCFPRFSSAKLPIGPRCPFSQVSTSPPNNGHGNWRISTMVPDPLQKCCSPKGGSCNPASPSEWAMG